MANPSGTPPRDQPRRGRLGHPGAASGDLIGAATGQARPAGPGAAPFDDRTADDPAAEERRPPVADPLRWSMVQDVLRALGRPVDPQELERVGRPLREEGEAESAAREPIEVRELHRPTPTRFDGRPVPEGPMTAGPRAPAPPAPGGMALALFTMIVLLLFAGLAAYVAVDFLHFR